MPRKISITGVVKDTKKTDNLAKARKAKAKKAAARQKVEDKAKEDYKIWLKEEKLAFEKMVNDRADASLAKAWKNLWATCPIGDTE